MPKFSAVGRRPTIGYVIAVKISGTNMNNGNSANDLPKKYASVRYRRLRCSRRKTGSSAQNTCKIGNFYGLLKIYDRPCKIMINQDIPG